MTVVQLLNAKSSHCRAIIGPSTAPNAWFCGEPVTIKMDLTQSSYCRAHHDMYYRERGSVSEFKRWERRVLSAPSSRNGRRA